MNTQQHVGNNLQSSSSSSSTGEIGNNVPEEGINTSQTTTEIPPTFYEELKLGQDGAGFKKLKP